MLSTPKCTQRCKKGPATLPKKIWESNGFIRPLGIKIHLFHRYPAEIRPRIWKFLSILMISKSQIGRSFGQNWPKNNICSKQIFGRFFYVSWRIYPAILVLVAPTTAECRSAPVLGPRIVTASKLAPHATRWLKNALSQDWSVVCRSNLFRHTLWILPALLGPGLVFLDVRIKNYARLIKKA